MDWETLVAAILGSTFLSTITGALIARFRFSRRAEVLSSWKDESELADKLERESGVEDSQRRERGKAAFAFAARADLNRRLANEMVPSDTASLLLKAVIVVVLIAVGLGFLGLGASGSFSLGLLNWAFSVFGSVVIVVSIFMLFAALDASTVRESMRSVIIRVLNATPPYSSKYVEVVSTSGSAQFKICNTGKWQKVVGNMLGRGVIANCEVFLGKIVNDLEVDVSDFQESPSGLSE